ncbi:IucA/IucC family protein [Methylomonas methanica]|uniref:IucA/IucC family protein n=1 Tax=Methylomonas methanica (strain DSM 25384 / MC09) TaxID=857087 RepID=G0A6D8_METMM|nr:IucA/IucC family protein [Methylomonas methanica]AEG01766.1 IucA/IucC family protein [Methylomonas methanica MC09]
MSTLALHRNTGISAAYCAASQRSLETQLNCYCREVAIPEGHASVGPLFGQNDWPLSLRCALATGQTLHIVLPRLDSRLVVAVRHDSATGNYRYLSAVYCKTAGQPWTLLDWRGLAALVIHDLAVKHNQPFNDELLAQIEDSVLVTATVLDAPWPDKIPRDPLQAYLDSEQSLTYGHPFHPAPKSRQGFTFEDLHRYSPELRRGFPLHYFAVYRDAVHQQSTVERQCSDIIAAHAPQGLAVDENYLLIPAHPWQARWLLEKPLMAKAMRDGRVRHLGAQGDLFYPTSSVRTLYQLGHPYFYKFSLHVRLTNCVRKNAVYELEGALQVNRIMSLLIPELRTLFPGTAIMEEPAYLSVDLKDGDERLNREITEGFGLILRRGFDANNLLPGVTPLLAGSLFGNHVLGEARLATLLQQFYEREHMTPEAATEEWFSRYVQQVMYPVLHCYFAHGVVFEPHLQNVVIGLANGSTAQVFLRDFEGVKLVPEHHPATRLSTISQRAREALWYERESGWKRVAYCLFVNNFCEAIHQLSGGKPGLQVRLWNQVRYHLQRYQAEHGSEESARRINALLAGEPLPGKGNLRNRFLRQSDRAADYVPLANPFYNLPENPA